MKSSLLFKLIIYASVWHGLAVGGDVKISETPVTGDRLSLASDLGIDNLTGLEFGVGLPIYQKGLLKISYTRFFFQGNAILPRDVFINGSRFQGGDRIDIHNTRYYRVLLLYEWLLLRRGEGEDKISVKGITGLVYDSLIFGPSAELSPLTAKGVDYENFSQQAIPIPLIGARFESALTPSTGLFLELYGAWLPGTYTGFVEGGKVKVWQEDIDLSAGLSKHIGPVIFNMGYHYMLFNMKEKSNEDFNDIMIEASGFKGGIEWRF